jgi:hypothetical protein
MSTGGVSNSLKGLLAGGVAPTNPTAIIDEITISTRGNAVDFGDLSAAAKEANGGGASNGHGGLQEFQPRAPELYSPTGKPLSQGAGIGNIGIFMGGKNDGGTAQSKIDFINISNLGNSLNFGDMGATAFANASFSSATRGFTAGGTSAAQSTDIRYIEMQSKGNASDFGDSTINFWYASGGSNSTRGITYGGEVSPAAVNTIQYVTMASIGNATDFGDLTLIRYTPISTGNSTRGICAGGYATAPTNSVVNIIDYITIGSTGNATDFGDLTQARYDGGAVSSTTRGVVGGGTDAGPNKYNILDYVTISSTGNATDFGDLTVARGGLAGCTGNSLRGLWAGGQSPTIDTIDYVTIASTGNAIDFGDLSLAMYGGCRGAISTGHGGLS